MNAAQLIYEDVLDLIHDTPLLELSRIRSGGAERARVLAKLEFFTPGASVKDRVALALISDAEKKGLLKAGGVVIEPTSGNTGIGLAVVCRRRGYRCILTMPESMSLERRQVLEAYGAELILTPESEQMEGAVAKAEALGRETPLAFLPRQFDNPANPRVHYDITAEEIAYALKGAGIVRVDAFVAAVGTGGTVSGVGRKLKELFPGCKVIGVEPETCATLSRGERGPSKIQGIAAGFVPGNYDPRVVDEVRTIEDHAAYAMKRELGMREGILVGISSGANVSVALDVAAEVGPGGTVVTVLCDTGERYFSLDEYFSSGDLPG